MYRTSSERQLLHAVNRHRETRRRRRRMRQVLREIRACAEEWFSGWWLA